MDDNEALRTTNLEAEEPSKRATAYDLLMRQSRKMGGVATRTYDVTKEFLKRDVGSITPRAADSLQFAKQLKGAVTNKKWAKKDKAIEDAVRQSHEVLAGIKTAWLPMNIFPDIIMVDRTKVTIHMRTFFWSSRVITTRIDDILGVTSSIGPIFGSLVISTRIMNSTDHYEINYFMRKDAIYLKEIIQGYVIAQHNNIDTKHLSKDKLIETLLELGRDAIE